MGMYLLKKYKCQFYCSHPNPYSGTAVNDMIVNDMPKFLMSDTTDQTHWGKLPRKVSYKRTFGVLDQGQTLDVWES